MGVLIVLWAVGVALGGVVLWRYQLGTDASPPAAPSTWPAESGLTRFEGFTLVMAAHPRCPCTRATMAELSRVMTRLKGRLRTRVLFVRPAGVPAGFEDTDLWAAALRIDDVEPLVDEGGHISSTFGARTSGAVALYDAEGQLVFRGGITASRGHEGANVGARRIVELVANGSTDRDQTSVFGCALFEGESS